MPTLPIRGCYSRTLPTAEHANGSACAHATRALSICGSGGWARTSKPWKRSNSLHPPSRRSASRHVGSTRCVCDSMRVARPVGGHAAFLARRMSTAVSYCCRSKVFVTFCTRSTFAECTVAQQLEYKRFARDVTRTFSRLYLPRSLRGTSRPWLSCSALQVASTIR
jgi:hypothetical protein